MKFILVAAALAASQPAIPAAAGSVSCGEAYTIRPGDTLQKLAEAVWGSDSSYQAIYSANREAIGPDPSLIRVGQTLAIPCLDAAATAPAEAFIMAVTAEPPTDSDMIRIVTASDWAPFIDERQEQGGMLTEIVNVAMSRVRPPSGYRIDFINDWSAQLRPLISDHAYDMSSAWFRPNCDVAEKLGAESRLRCDTLDWSDPIFEQVIGYYMTPETAATVSTHADLKGRTICRPAGYATYMLEEKDLVPPFVALATPDTPADCLEGLASGAYDAVVLAAEVASDAIAAQRLTGRVVAVDQLAAVATLHLVTAKTNPRGKEKLELFNTGLRALRNDGEWFNIVSRHMAAHQAKSRG